VYNMSLFLVACLLNKWQRASSARCLQNKAKGLTTSRSSKCMSKAPCPDSPVQIAAEIAVSQRCALSQQSCKPLCPLIFDMILAHAVYSYLFSSKPKCKPEGYHAVCVPCVTVSSCLSAKQMSKSKQCKVPTKQGQRPDHATKVEASLPRHRRFYCT
jgi:hypothetical protein